MKSHDDSPLLRSSDASQEHDTHQNLSRKSNVFERGSSCNSRFVLKPDVAITSRVSISIKDFLAITDFLAKRTQLANYW